ncbi:hypothetical protein PTKIN_Ptkin14bG0026900 [Pterospermum kingtungense]
MPRLSRLEFLGFGFNHLEGSIPDENIYYLDQSSNLIHGDLPIPPWTTYVFFLSNNNLSGEITSLICNANSLGFLDLSHNNLSGTIPQCFGNLSRSVSMLNLQMNKLHGIIPPTFTKGCQLKNLNLNGNELEGPLTRSILNCTSLEVLDLGNNKIKGTFPHWLGSRPQLQVLILRSNQLKGSIHGSRSSASFSKIQIFDLSNNYFTRRLPVRYIKNFNAMINLTFNGSAKEYIGESDERGSFYTYSIGTAMKGILMEVVKERLTSQTISLKERFQSQIPQGKQFDTFETIHMKETEDYVDFQSLKVAPTMSSHFQTCWKKMAQNQTFFFGWKVVLIGYGCGVVFGLAIG